MTIRTDITATARQVARTLLATAALLLSTPTLAQGAGAGEGHQLRIALLESVDAATPLARVVRAPEPREPDVLVIRGDQATPQVVRAGIAFAKEFRKDVPRVNGTAVATMGSYVQTRRSGPRNDAAEARARDIIARARTQPLVTIGNLGRGRWVQLDVASLDP